MKLELFIEETEKGEFLVWNEDKMESYEISMDDVYGNVDDYTADAIYVALSEYASLCSKRGTTPSSRITAIEQEWADDNAEKEMLANSGRI